MNSFIIDRELPIQFQDEGPWRNYYLVSDGTKLVELIDNAVIFEVDKSGKDLRNYPLNKASKSVFHEAMKVICSYSA